MADTRMDDELSSETEDGEERMGWQVVTNRRSRSAKKSWGAGGAANLIRESQGKEIANKGAAGADKLKRRIVKASRMPQLPEERRKIIVRPRGGLNLNKLCNTSNLEVTRQYVIFGKDSDDDITDGGLSEWKSQAFTLATEEMQERHTGENIMQRMQEVISAWKLDGKVTAVVTDNASNGINAVNALQAKKAQNLEISQQEWNVISELCEVLEPLQLATTILCSDTVSPVSTVRPVAKAVVKKLELQSTGDLQVENFKEVVRMEISRRFSLDWDAQQRSVSARQRASFLDPRYKCLQYEEPDAREAIRSNVREMLNLLSPSADESGMGTTQTEATALDILFNEQPRVSDPSAQFDAYLSEPQLGHNMDALKWWKDNEPKFPLVAELAKKYMCIPASSASSERVFSTAGNIITAKRSCLLPENVSSLVFLYQNRAYMDI
ncbi:E3 SUMO-protein ligase ZBED1-like [Dermacentor andersoni]|uniref:E3 SUMO-protein ligase ZBED1-like n=1 Tax=Dermacentor andersoni TaxID=34620 RepID=UPI003B3ADDE4